MAEIVPAINATDPKDYAARIDRVEHFARRIHVDISDGVFDPVTTVGLAQVYGVKGAELDLHLMVQDPAAHFENAVSLHPNLIIVHAEADGDLKALIHRIKEVGIKVGIAVKEETTVEEVKHLLPLVDHFLDFTGTLGYNGSDFHAECLTKVAEAHQINPQLEISVDGGVGLEEVPRVATAGAQVAVCGSAIHDAADPAGAFVQLQEAAA
jgi:ribulose-phosphate 3-epimerase